MIRNSTPPKNDVGCVSGQHPCVKFISKRAVARKGDVPWIRRNQSAQTLFALTTGMQKHLLNPHHAPMFRSFAPFVQLAVRPSGHTVFMPISESATDLLLSLTFHLASNYLSLRKMVCNAFGRLVSSGPKLIAQRKSGSKMCLLRFLRPTVPGFQSTQSKLPILVSSIN